MTDTPRPRRVAMPLAGVLGSTALSITANSVVAVAVPWLCCSAPRAVRIIALSAVSASSVCCSWSTPTPVMRSTLSGQ